MYFTFRIVIIKTLINKILFFIVQNTFFFSLIISSQSLPFSIYYIFKHKKKRLQTRNAGLAVDGF